MYIKKNAPSMNLEQGYQLPPIYRQLLLPGHFPRRKTSRDREFLMRSRNVVKSFEIRSKVSQNLFTSMKQIFPSLSRPGSVLTTNQDWTHGRLGWRPSLQTPLASPRSRTTSGRPPTSLAIHTVSMLGNLYFTGLNCLRRVYVVSQFAGSSG